jgi:hypothetical protein
MDTGSGSVADLNVSTGRVSLGVLPYYFRQWYFGRRARRAGQGTQSLPNSRVTSAPLVRFSVSGSTSLSLAGSTATAGSAPRRVLTVHSPLVRFSVSGCTSLSLAGSSDGGVRSAPCAHSAQLPGAKRSLAPRARALCRRFGGAARRTADVARTVRTGCGSGKHRLVIHSSLS